MPNHTDGAGKVPASTGQPHFEVYRTDTGAVYKIARMHICFKETEDGEMMCSIFTLPAQEEKAPKKETHITVGLRVAIDRSLMVFSGVVQGHELHTDDQSFETICRGVLGYSK